MPAAPLFPWGDAWAFMLSALGLVATVGLGEGLRAVGASSDTTRRLVHVLTGLFCAATPWVFEEPGPIYVLALLFAGVNAAAILRGWLPGMHAVRRASWGTVAFPLALVAALWVCWTLEPTRQPFLVVAFLLLALADPLAAWAGERVRRDVGAEGKTWQGSAAFALAAVLLGATTLTLFHAAGVLRGWTPADVALATLVLAWATTLAEALGRRGWDNFFLVAAALAVLVAFDERPEARGWLAWSAVIGTVFAALAQRVRFVDQSGALAVALFAASVLGLGGWAWALPAVAFFVLSSLLSKLGVRRKRPAAARAEKGNVRDAGQVYANGGVAWMLLVLHAVAPHPLLYAGFVGAFAAAAADTWATELGTLFGGWPRLVTSGRRVPAGTSGAVTLAGTAGAALGAAVVAAAALLGLQLQEAPWPVGWPWLVLAGFAGAWADSLAGATVQARYRDAGGGLTEHARDAAGRPHERVLGWRGVGNDRVNVLCTAVGALLAMLAASA